MKFFLIFLSILCLLFSSCGKQQVEMNKPTNSISEVKEGARSRVIYLGDPDVLIRGAKLSPELPFTIDNASEFSGFQLYSTVAFVSKKTEPIIEKTDEDYENENAPAKEEIDYSFNPEYEFVDYYNLHRNFYYQEKGEQGYLEFQLLFRKYPGDPKLKLIKVDQHGIATYVKVLNYSEVLDKENKRLAFSILVRGETSEDGVFIKKIVFVKKTDKTFSPDNGNKRYNYLMGAGIRYRWQDNITIHGCTFDSQEKIYDEELNHLKDVIAMWNTELVKVNKKIEMGETIYGIPYSDIRKNCIYFVKGLNAAYLSSGQTENVTISKNKNIFSSSIMIFYDSASDFRIQKTLIHEMGHFLGLDHQFNGTPSIMSYSDEREAKLTDYDKAAILELYR